MDLLTRNCKLRKLAELNIAIEFLSWDFEWMSFVFVLCNPLKNHKTLIYEPASSAVDVEVQNYCYSCKLLHNNTIFHGSQIYLVWGQLKEILLIKDLQ